MALADRARAEARWLDGTEQRCVGNLVSVHGSVAASVFTQDNGTTVCTLHDNNPSLGDYYTTPPTVLQDAANLALVLGPPRPELLLGGSPDLNLPAAKGYSPGMELQSLVTSTNPASRDQFLVSGALSSLDADTFSTSCADASPTRFLHSSTSNCTRDVTSLASLCRANSPLHIANYLGQIVASVPADSASAITATVNKPWLCNGGTSCSPGLVTPALSSDGLTCNNVVTSVLWTVGYTNTSAGSDATFRITQVTVDWSFATWTADPIDTPGSSPVFQQQFGVRYLEDSLPASSKLAVRSGSPGYQPGRPVTFLRNTTNPSAAAGPAYLASPHPQTGECQTAVPAWYSASPFRAFDALAPVASSDDLFLALLASDASGLVPIRFGVESSVSCTLPWPTSPPSPAACLALQQWAGIWPLSHVAEFGNASVAGYPTAADAGQWVPVFNDTSAAIGAPASASSAAAAVAGTACMIPTAVELDFVWTDTGSARAPQSVIVGARVTRGRYRNVATVPAAVQKLPPDMQVVHVATTVKWTRATREEIEVETWYPPPPRLFPPLPKDWLYPFL
ncbi:hypothetical protein H9P43_001986 [Blastocladiella emersonii ATCC 22665]|nr:hypothetical protein H9P43_001986 [Blastocladiella emersonii ATCC 22665]